MAYFPFKTFVATWEFLTRVTYFSILKSNVNLNKALEKVSTYMEWALSWFCSCIYLIGLKLIRKWRRDLPQIMLPELGQINQKETFIQNDLLLSSELSRKQSTRHPADDNTKKIPTVTKARACSHAARAIP